MIMMTMMMLGLWIMVWGEQERLRELEEEQFRISKLKDEKFIESNVLDSVKRGAPPRVTRVDALQELRFSIKLLKNKLNLVKVRHGA